MAVLGYEFYTPLVIDPVALLPDSGLDIDWLLGAIEEHPHDKRLYELGIHAVRTLAIVDAFGEDDTFCVHVIDDDRAQLVGTTDGYATVAMDINDAPESAPLVTVDQDETHRMYWLGIHVAEIRHARNQGGSA